MENNSPYKVQRFCAKCAAKKLNKEFLENLELIREGISRGFFNPTKEMIFLLGFEPKDLVEPRRDDGIDQAPQ